MTSEYSGGPHEQAAYRGKHFTVPSFSTDKGIEISPNPAAGPVAIPANSPIVRSLNGTWDVRNFSEPRRPDSLGVLPPEQHAVFAPGMPRTLDMPIKFPGSEFRLPREFAQLAPLLQRVADCEAAINSACYDEYYCYLTVDQGEVTAGKLQREAPCHVDGFQGARWNPKVRNNHTYTISDRLPTVYYVQPFHLEMLDESRHNFFWEMNRQVAQTNSQHAWVPQPFELTLMDCYTVHRGAEAPEPMFRTFLRMSFEVRIFDRLGNAHNPLFRYDWPMVPRDIEGLNLVAFDPQSDPSLRVFPWQKPDGTAQEDPRLRTQPNLRPGSSQ
jgi:hypothetical protein